MAGTINYLFDPNQVVYVIIPCSTDNTDTKIKEAKVIRIRAEVLLTGQELEYDVQIVGNPGTTRVPEADMFATLALAGAEYEIRLA